MIYIYIRLYYIYIIYTLYQISPNVAWTSPKLSRRPSNHHFKRRWDPQDPPGRSGRPTLGDNWLVVSTNQWEKDIYARWCPPSYKLVYNPH